MSAVDVDPVRQVADLLLVRYAVSAPEGRRRLARVTRTLRAGIEPGIPKHRAAALLGVSPQALERWVRRGAIPTVRRPGSSRELIDRDALISLVGETEASRDAGARSPLAAAVAGLSKQGKLTPRPRPNQSARELRYERSHGSPAGRVRVAVALSQTTIAMAARAHERARTALPTAR